MESIRTPYVFPYRLVFLYLVTTGWIFYISFFFFFFFISLIADGPHHYHPACGHKESSDLSPVHALHFLSRCKLSTLTTRQPTMVEFYLLAFPRFPLRKKEHKSYSGKNRTHDFRTTSRCAAYLLDHSGDLLVCENPINQSVDALLVATYTLKTRNNKKWFVCFGSAFSSKNSV